MSKWLKWLIPVALLTYGASNAFNYLVENGTIFRNSEVVDKSVDVSQSTVRFKDVCGCDEARAGWRRLLTLLKDPSKFTGLGGKLPKGELLTGPSRYR